MTNKIFNYGNPYQKDRRYPMYGKIFKFSKFLKSYFFS